MVSTTSTITNQTRKIPEKKTFWGIKLQTKDQGFIRNTAYTIAAILFLSSIATLNPANIITASLLLFFSYAYSAPPRIKTKPPLDSISNGLIYALLPAMLGFSFGNNLTAFPPKGYFVTLGVVGFHAFSTIMDYSVDKKANDQTFAVAFGKRTAATFGLTTLIIIALFSQITTPIINYYLFFCIAIMLITTIYPSEKLTAKFFALIIFGFIITAVIFLVNRLF